VSDNRQFRGSARQASGRADNGRSGNRARVLQFLRSYSLLQRSEGKRELLVRHRER
jgi:hypothetical protein